MSFEQSSSDPCIYTSKTESDGMFILAMYVHNILLAGMSQQKIAQVKTNFWKLFLLKDMGELHHFFGINIQQHSNEIWISQPTYTKAIIKKLWMEDCKLANTSVTQGATLLKAIE